MQAGVDMTWRCVGCVLPVHHPIDVWLVVQNTRDGRRGPSQIHPPLSFATLSLLLLLPPPPLLPPSSTSTTPPARPALPRPAHSPPFRRPFVAHSSPRRVLPPPPFPLLRGALLASPPFPPFLPRTPSKDKTGQEASGATSTSHSTPWREGVPHHLQADPSSASSRPSPPSSSRSSSSQGPSRPTLRQRRM